MAELTAILLLRKIAIAFLVIAVLMVVLIALVMQPFSGRGMAIKVHVDPEKLKSHVRYLSVDLYPRSFEQEHNLNLAAGYVYQQFKLAGADTSFQEFRVQDVTYKNVIAHFGPVNGSLMVVGAHYDSDGDANAGAKYPLGYSRATHTPGADDNASGVAGLIELARMLQLNPPKHPVELVAYTLEEMPFFRTQYMGSMWHSRELARQGKQVELMLSLEMIGYFSDDEGSQTYPLPGMEMLYPRRGNYIAVVGRFGNFSVTRRVKSIMSGATDLPVYSINAPALIPGIDFSDHRSYWLKGYPALMITDTAFYRNPGYHGAEDTYDKLDYKRMANVVESVYSVIENFDVK